MNTSAAQRGLSIIGADAVAALLTPASCFDAMRDAMESLSAGKSRQLLRSILSLGPERDFGIMPGALAVDGNFGAKLISVMPDGQVDGRRRHRGVIALFAPDGAPIAIVDAEEVTAQRTAAASALATDALADPAANRLALVGAGLQAERHAVAIARIRPLSSITVWSRDVVRARSLCASLEKRLGIAATAAGTVTESVRDADIICTLTGSPEPLLFSNQVADGAHINAVGSGTAAHAEIDGELVARSRFFADSSEGVRSQGGEWRRALSAGLVQEDHLVGEIGEVLLGSVAGRTGPCDVTIYKSLGHVVQDLAAAECVYRQYCATI